MNKKAQLDKILSSFPVFLLIFLLIAIYLILSVFAFALKHPDIPAKLENVETQPLLLNEITINQEKISLLNALIKFNNKEINREDIYKELEKLVDKNNNILLLATGDEENPRIQLGGLAFNNFIIEFKNGKLSYHNPGSYTSTFSRYNENDLLNKLSFTINTKDGLKTLFIEYYYGRSLE